MLLKYDSVMPGRLYGCFLKSRHRGRIRSPCNFVAELLGGDKPGEALGAGRTLRKGAKQLVERAFKGDISRHFDCQSHYPEYSAEIDTPVLDNWRTETRDV